VIPRLTELLCRLLDRAIFSLWSEDVDTDATSDHWVPVPGRGGGGGRSGGSGEASGRGHSSQLPSRAMVLEGLTGVLWALTECEDMVVAETLVRQPCHHYTIFSVAKYVRREMKSFTLRSDTVVLSH
jgi:hypothetical protein